MDKYEYKVRAEEIKTLIAEGEFAEAVKIADTIDWRRVKSVMMLCTISDLYKINRRFQESKDVLLMAYERHPGGRLIVYSLCELSIKMGEFVQAIEYYKEFVQIAPKDTGRYILQYKLYEAQDVSLEERIAVLEEFKKRDYREKWAYELAYLYHRVGLETKCVEECDEMVLWFGEGRYVMKALELKALHQPLTAQQQEKYQQMKLEAEQAQLEEDASEQAEEQPEEQNVGEQETEEAYPEEQPSDNRSDSKIESFPQYVQPEPEEEEEEFRVKTVDVGQYNTINLQRELAESMKEILEEPETEDLEKSYNTSMGAITQSIVAPLLEETGDLPQVETEEAVAAEETSEAPAGEKAEPIYLKPEEAADIQEIKERLIKKMPEPPTATEEVFFEEDVKDILLEDTKEIHIGEAGKTDLGDTREIHPKRRVIYPTVPAVQPESQTASQPEPQAARPQSPGPANIQKPSGFEQMLSQEYDGQISLVVPSKNDVEKQITGQMNISDIMAEWERMKRENEEKRREDVRKRVQQHTGNLFSEFDEATKVGLLEQLEKAVVEAIMKESGEKPVNPGEITAQKLTDIVKGVEKNTNAETSNTEDSNTEALNTETSNTEMPVAETSETEASEAQVLEAEAVDTEASVQNEQEKLPGAEKPVQKAEVIDLENISQKENTVPEKEEEATAQKLRALSEEERELFGKFINNRKIKEQIIHAIDTMSMDSYSGNVIITGEEGSSTLDLAKALIRMLQMSDNNFSGKIAKISGSTLNKKGVQDTLSKLMEGALIIEHATAMSSSTATDLNKALARENSGIFVIMEGKKDEMNIFLRKNFALMDNFNARIDVESLDDQALVEYAKQYAEEMEYSIDELGILALHTRIADMQTSDHEVTVAEVKDLVDDAIYFADKKNPKHFFDILFGKRYDEEDMIILREKDFMHY